MKHLFLRHKIFLAMAAVILVFSLVLVVLVEVYVETKIAKEGIEDGKALVMGMALHITPLVQQNDVASVAVFAEELMRTNGEIEYVFIRKDGQTIFSTFRSGVPRELLVVKHRPDTVDHLAVTVGGQPFIDYAAPLEGTSGAVLRLGIDERIGQAAIHEIMFTIFLITVLVIMLAFVVSILLAKRLTSSIADLTASATLIAAGDYERKVAVSGTDEVSRLALAFNTMLQAVRLREQELRSLNTELETVNSTLHEYIGKLRDADEALVRSKQDTAVVETARTFLHHLRQPLTYLTMAIDLLVDELTEGTPLSYETAKRRLDAIHHAGARLSELLTRFEGLQTYRVIEFDELSRILDIGDGDAKP